MLAVFCTINMRTINLGIPIALITTRIDKESADKLVVMQKEQQQRFLQARTNCMYILATMTATRLTAAKTMIMFFKQPNFILHAT